jgi:hypothetical protein
LLHFLRLNNFSLFGEHASFKTYLIDKVDTDSLFKKEKWAVQAVASSLECKSNMIFFMYDGWPSVRLFGG